MPSSSWIHNPGIEMRSPAVIPRSPMSEENKILYHQQWSANTSWQRSPRKKFRMEYINLA